MNTCSVCGGQGYVVSVTRITCGKGCCEAIRNEWGLKIIKGSDPTKCGDAAKHLAIGLCRPCSGKLTFQLPTEFLGANEPRPAVISNVTPAPVVRDSSVSVTRPTAVKVRTRSR